MKETVKYCGGCRTQKPIAAFANSRREPDRHQSHCRVCQAIYQRKYRGDARQREQAEDDAVARRDSREMRQRQPAAATHRVMRIGSAEQE